MRLKVPLTGTVLVEGSVWGAGDLKGDDNDPIRPIPIDLGNVSWKMVDVDLEGEVMIIEVSPTEEVDENTGQIDEEGKPIYQRRKATNQEKQEFLKYARNIIEGHTRDELHSMTGAPRLKRKLRL